MGATHFGAMIVGTAIGAAMGIAAAVAVGLTVPSQVQEIASIERVKDHAWLDIGQAKVTQIELFGNKTVVRFDDVTCFQGVSSFDNWLFIKEGDLVHLNGHVFSKRPDGASLTDCTVSALDEDANR